MKNLAQRIAALTPEQRVLYEAKRKKAVHLAGTIRQATDSLPSRSPLVKIQSGGSKKPFFCMPGSVGTVIYFYHLAHHLGSDQPFYGLQARGVDCEQAPHTRIEDIAAYNLEALKAVQPQGPYFLGGHSFGSYVAFQMALQLQKQGQKVALLALIDTLASIPHNQPVEVDYEDARDLSELVHLIERFYGKNFSLSYDAFQQLQPDGQLDYVLEWLKAIKILPPQTSFKQLRDWLQVFKINVLDEYLPQSIYPEQITLFRAKEQELSAEPTLGWDKFSCLPIEIYEVPGDHVTMMAEPHVQVLAKQLRGCLDRAQAND